jgi:hypothetical protein
METPAPGDLVRLDDGSGAVLDGIVFDRPSRLKAIVAVVDPARGPGFRTVHPDGLTAREAAGSDDAALRSLIRRTPTPSRSGVRDGGGARKAAPGFSRGTSHRPTGR